jgi:hypothetical protein
VEVVVKKLISRTNFIRFGLVSGIIIGGVGEILAMKYFNDKFIEKPQKELHAQKIAWNENGIEYSCKLLRGYEIKWNSIDLTFSWRMEDITSRVRNESPFIEKDLLRYAFGKNQTIENSFRIYTKAEEQFLLEQLASFENPYQVCAQKFLETK